MNKFDRISMLYCLVLFLLIQACTDPTNVGAELLSGDRIDIGFNDTLNVSAKTVYGDSLIVFNPPSSISRFFAGDYFDPIFGRVTTSFSTEIRMPRNAAGAIEIPDIGDSFQVDSVILDLPITESISYGPVNEPFNIEVFELTDTLGRNSIHYSNEVFPFDPTPLTPNMMPVSITPNFDTTDLLVYDEESRIDTTISISTLRLPLDISFGNRFRMADTTIYTNDSTLTDFFKGFHIRVASNTQGLLGFGLPIGAGLFIYTSRLGTDEQRQYLFPISTPLSQFNIDRTGAVVDNFVDDPAAADSLVFVQGLSGTLVELSVDDLDPIRDKILNKAELEFTVFDLPGDNDAYNPPAQLALFVPNEDGNLQLITDAIFSQNIDNNRLTFFGGGIEEEAGMTTYRMNITLQLTEILEGSAENSFFLWVFQSSQLLDGIFQPTGDPSRAVLGGVENSSFPIRLRVAFTDL